MKKLQAVLLDVDGTLVDSNDAHAQAWLEVLEHNGYRASLDRVRQLIGEGGDKLLPEVAGVELDSHEGKRLSAERAARFRKYLPDLRAFPGAEALLHRFKSAGLKLVVASSAKSGELTPLLELCGALPLLEAESSSDDARHSKPDPDIVQVALRKAHCSPAEAIMLGDTPYDVVAALRAGVGSVALRSGGHPDSALQKALAIYDDPADLLANFEASVFVERI